MHTYIIKQINIIFLILGLFLHQIFSTKLLQCLDTFPLMRENLQ